MQWERINGKFWIAIDGWRTNQKKLQRAWKRRALLIQLAGDSGYLAARGPVLTCQQALMAIFWVLPTVTHPKRGQQDRKGSSSSTLETWATSHCIHFALPVCPGGQSMCLHTWALLLRLLALRTRHLCKGWQVLPLGHLSPPLQRGGQTLWKPPAVPIYLHLNSQWRFQFPVPT